MTQVIDRPTLAALTEDQRRKAMACFEVLFPHVNGGVPLTRAAAEAGVPLRTAQRWLAVYRAQGLGRPGPPPRR